MTANIKRILIANRGEIARRIIRACDKLGIETVAIYSDEDRHALYTKEATISLNIGGRSSAESYLKMDKIIALAKQYQVCAIHPGYGFLSENAEFALACRKNNIRFIGPTPESIKLMGLKNESKDLAARAGVPTIPGYQGENQDLKRFSQEAQSMGFPVMLKASAGGGGKGMMVAWNAQEMKEAFERAQREAISSFGNGHLILERYFPNSKHIEIQVFGDKQGNVIHLYERECSMQRRHQKIIEEAPSPSISESTRQEMAKAAVNLAKAVQYVGAGTVEFIYDLESTRFYFLEMNTRLQVEHPVTEEILGIDLVQWQIAIENGSALPLSQEQVRPCGHSIEVRLYAEDPNQNFMPQSGEVKKLDFSQLDCRVESALDIHDRISTFYDPMVAKVLSYAPTREQACAKLLKNLNAIKYWGPANNLQYLKYLLQHPQFIDKSFNTKTAEKVPDLTGQFQAEWALAYHLYHRQIIYQQTGLPAGLRIFPQNNFHYTFTYQGKQHSFVIQQNARGTISLNNLAVNVLSDKEICFEYNHKKNQFELELSPTNNEGAQVFLYSPETGSINFQYNDPFPDAQSAVTEGDHIAPMPGKIVQVLAKRGAKVASGDRLIILEAMKMENPICAQKSGVIESLFVEQGQQVESGQILLNLRNE